MIRDIEYWIGLIIGSVIVGIIIGLIKVIIYKIVGVWI